MLHSVYFSARLSLPVALVTFELTIFCYFSLRYFCSIIFCLIYFYSCKKVRGLKPPQPLPLRGPWTLTAKLLSNIRKMSSQTVTLLSPDIKDCDDNQHDVYYQESYHAPQEWWLKVFPTMTITNCWDNQKKSKDNVKNKRQKQSGALLS